MNTYIILLRGINVGGKNKVPMKDLKIALEKEGFSNVLTYIASGNIILDSRKAPKKIKEEIENLLPKVFKLDSELIKVLVFTPQQLQKTIQQKPKNFGELPEKYHSDVAFLIDVSSKEAMKAFQIKEGIDTLWQGDGVIYFQRLSSQRTKSKLNKIMSSPYYKSMTIRNWNTTTKLFELLNDRME